LINCLVKSPWLGGRIQSCIVYVYLVVRTCNWFKNKSISSSTKLRPCTVPLTSPMFARLRDNGTLF
jgi:hypothetical protein